MAMLHLEGRALDWYHFYIQEYGDPMEEEQSPLPILSLHAIKGSHGPHTMRFEAKIGTCTAIFLVYTGSTHNFLSATLVAKLSILMC